MQQIVPKHSDIKMAETVPFAEIDHQDNIFSRNQDPRSTKFAGTGYFAGTRNTLGPGSIMK